MNALLRVAVSLAVAGAFAAPGWAGGVGQCITMASDEYKECKSDCKEAFQAAKDACTNKDHVCVDACREGRASCIEDTGLEVAIDACNDGREVAVATCKSIYGPDTPERDQCIDNAQLDAFQCRDGAREAAKPSLVDCRKGFKACRDVCPAGAGPVVDVKQCRLDATVAYKACQAACREDFQLDKDACRNLDHDCVESCRTARELCKDPVQATLETAVAACKTTRDAVVALCNGEDGCIDQAQAVAFQCRDAAREVAQPGFTACRDAFKACVRPACATPAP